MLYNIFTTESIYDQDWHAIPGVCYKVGRPIINTSHQLPCQIQQPSLPLSHKASRKCNACSNRVYTTWQADDQEGTPRFTQPCLAAGGGGIFFFWQLGALEYVMEHYDLQRMQFVGASAGALLATIAACGVSPKLAVQQAYRLSLDADLWSKRFGLLGIWGHLIRQWLGDILPEDAHEKGRTRLRLVATDVLLRRQVYLQDFTDREDLMNAIMASIHIPLFLDYRPFSIYRGRAAVDGSLSDFLFWENGKLLVMEGRSFVLDYSQDEELKYQRLDFIRLRSYESIKELIQRGKAYAARVDARGGFQTTLGNAKLDL